MKFTLIFMNKKTRDNFKIIYNENAIASACSWRVAPPHYKTKLIEPNGGVRYYENRIEFWGGPRGARKCVAILEVPGSDMSKLTESTLCNITHLWLKGDKAATMGKDWKWILKEKK